MVIRRTVSNLLKMKRNTRISTRTGVKSEDIESNELNEVSTKASGRNARKQPSTSGEGQEISEHKVDLSKFKLPEKQRLQSGNETEKSKRLKKEHISVTYDDELGKESKEESPEISTSFNRNSINQPSDWEEVIKNLREMRKDSNAPVDTMGCDQCPDENASPEDKRFQSLLSLMLSSQTKDQVTHAAMLRLREHGCSLTNILGTSDEKLGQLIYPVSFWKTKVKNIKRTSEMISSDFDGDIPKTVEDLCKLPGVGPKMAHLCMKTAWGQITGIGVDTHVHRISNRLGWVKTKSPDDTRKALEGWLPRDLWSEIGLLLVGFGQQICKPVKPLCGSCLNNQICPFGRTETRGLKKKGK